MSNKKTAVHIGNERIHRFMSEHYPQWEWQQSLETIEDYDKNVDNDVDIVFILDRLYDTTGKNEQFQQFVTQVSQKSMVGIVNYHPERQEDMHNSITDYAHDNGLPLPEYYLINKQRPIPSIDEAVSTYFKEEDK